jgi:hypothetical protein
MHSPQPSRYTRAGTSLIVLKEFPAKYRNALRCFVQTGFARPEHADGDPEHRLSQLRVTPPWRGSKMRKLRRKFDDAAEAGPIGMTLVEDIAPFVDDIYPSAGLRTIEPAFRKLTKEFFLSTRPEHAGQGAFLPLAQ